MKKRMSLFFALLMILALFTGCGVGDRDTVESGVSDPSTAEMGTSNPVEEKDESKTTLRVLVDSRSGETVMFRTQLNEWALKFGSEYDVEIVIEEIPTDKNERKAFIKQKNEEIASGNEPDVMLLQNEFSAAERLKGKYAFFEDVNFVMRCGIFYDLSELYAADAELHTEQLSKVLMDAGVCDGKRYILPMRFDVPVAYVDTQAFDETGLDRGIFGSVSDLFRGIAGIEDKSLVSKFNIDNVIYGLALNNFIDYENQKVNIDEDAMLSYIEAFQGYCTVRSSVPDYSGSILPTNLQNYVFTKKFWAIDESPFKTSSLQDALENLLIAGVNDVELEILPIRAADDAVTASITLYGAVGANCKTPELAYKFIRKFLTEEQQWGKCSGDGVWYLSAPGWPVRVNGSVEALKDSLLNRSGVSQEYDIFKDIALTDENIPVLNSIDKACFSVYELNNAFNFDMWLIFNDNKARPNVQADYGEAALDWVNKLQKHINEG